MIYLDLHLNNLCGCNGDIGCIYPEVRIGMDCDDNVDVVKLRKFQNNLSRYIDKGLNDCIIHNDIDATASQLAQRTEL